MLENVLREIAINEQSKQGKMVDCLLEEAPILADIPMEAASHGLFNVYEELQDVEGAEAVALDGALPEAKTSTSLKQQDLNVLGAIIRVGEDKAKRFGGPTNYFAKQYGPVLKKSGSDIERALIYNTFRKYAIDNGNYVKAGGTTANNNYSIVAVHYSPGEVIGLYDPEGFGRKQFFDVKPINGGTLYLNPDTKQLEYGIRLKSYFGMQLANKNYVSAITNIDKTADIDATMIDDLLTNTRAKPENTLIYMHPAMLNKLQKLKGSQLNLMNVDRQVDRRLFGWNGVAIIPSYNFLGGTEAIVS